VEDGLSLVDGGGEELVSRFGSDQIAEWRPDPFGRWPFRRYFLGQPTSRVSTGEVEGMDPVTPLLLPKEPSTSDVETSASLAVSVQAPMGLTTTL
jgi:hypothetical protein